MGTVNRRDGTGPRRNTLADLVESRIEQEIVEGRVAPGDRLDEEELAARLSTSRTPVREALRKLAATGLVTIRPRAGAHVTRPTMTEIIELFETVSALEAFAARLAAERATVAQLESIQAAHALCNDLAASGDAKAYFEANRVFHNAVWEAANNQVLRQQIAAVDKRLSPYRRQITFHPNRTQDSQTEHDQIAQALADRKPEIAEKAMRDHVMILSDDAMQLARDLKL